MTCFFFFEVQRCKKHGASSSFQLIYTQGPIFFQPTKESTKETKQMTILPLSTPGRNTPSTQHSSYFPPSSSASNSNGPTIGLPGQEGFRRKSDGGGYGFGSSASTRVHGHHQSSSMSSFIPLFLRRLFRFPHMDFQVHTAGSIKDKMKRSQSQGSGHNGKQRRDVNVRGFSILAYSRQTSLRYGRWSTYAYLQG